MKAMTREQLAKLSPAAIAVGSDETRTSGRYGFVSTLSAIEFLENEGFHVTGASQMFARKKDNRFVRHVVTMTHDNDLKADDQGAEAIPQILLFNSHNGTTALKLQTGFFRFVCANGLIVGETMSEVKMRHSSSIHDLLADQLSAYAAQTQESVQLIDRWKTKKLTAGAMDAFAKRAAEIRVAGGNEASYYEPREILKPRRDDDDNNSLWSVFNRVQENLVKGGIQGQRESGRLVTLRPLTNIRKNTEFNQQLWKLAEEVGA